MKCFIWNEASGVTFSYHEEAGVVVFAKDLPRAIKLLGEADIRKDADVFTVPPDVEMKANGAPEGVFVFPNAGCC